MRASQLSFLRVLLLFFALALSFKVTLSLSSAPQPLYAEENVPNALGSISGVVRNAAGEPLAGMEMKLYRSWSSYWSEERQVTTQADGTYRFALLLPGIFQLAVSDGAGVYGRQLYTTGGNNPGASEIPVAGNQVRADLTLQPAGHMIGSIVGSGGLTFTNKLVELYRDFTYPSYLNLTRPNWQPIESQTLSMMTDTFQFDGLGSERYRICATAVQDQVYWRECYDNVYNVNDAADITATAGTTTTGLSMVLGDGADYAQIGGHVTNAANEPLANIDVYIRRPADPTYYPGYGTLADAQSLDYFDPATTIIVGIEPPPFAYIAATKTDASGHYHFSALAADLYQVAFRDATGQYRAEFYNDAVTLNDATILTVGKREILTDVNATLLPGAQIRGTITIDGQPVPAADVFLSRKNTQEDEPRWWPQIAHAQSDPQTGAYLFSGLAAGIYRVMANAYIYGTIGSYNYSGLYGGTTIENAASITLTTGQTRGDIDILLSNGPHFESSISGHVTATGKAQSGIKVLLYSRNNCCEPSYSTPIIYTTTDQAGNYRLAGLTDGTYYLRFQDTTNHYAPVFQGGAPIPYSIAPLVLNDSDVITGQNVALQEAGKIEGSVHRIDGKAVPDLVVLAILLDDQNFNRFILTTVPVDPTDGHYQLTGLYPGNYHICLATNYPLSSTETTKCYGETGSLLWFDDGIAVPVTPGKTVTAIDILWGPDYEQYLPVVRR